MKVADFINDLFKAWKNPNQYLTTTHYKQGAPIEIFLKKGINFVCIYKKRLYICNVNKDKTDRPGCRNKKISYENTNHNQSSQSRRD